MSTFKLPHIRKRSCRPYPESGAGTVEYVIVFLVGRLPSDDEIECTVDYSLPFTPTGTDGKTPGTVQLKKINGSPSVFSGQSHNFHIGQAAYLADTQKPVKMVAHLSSTKYGSKDVEFSSGLPTLNNAASDRTTFGYSDSVNGIVTGNPWNFD